MIFNSLTFGVFFVIFFFLYWLIAHRKWQNLFLLAGSYFFYGWFDWRFLALLAGSSAFHFIIGQKLGSSVSDKQKNRWYISGILLSVGLLIYYKYTNFFIQSAAEFLNFFNIRASYPVLNLVMPLGISFFTFRNISYLIDIRNGRIKVCASLSDYMSYVAFFPSLVSGPIDRPGPMIAQMEAERKFDVIVSSDALRQILWGLFKKIVVADTLAIATQPIFDHYQTIAPSVLLLGAFYFSIQLYADFSGYSDMAIGIAALLGFRITKNFDFPYFSSSIAEFWRKWHISLTSWLTDYIFTPISIWLRDYGKWSLFTGILVTFLISGLWHGASMTFVVWGFLHGLYFIPSVLSGNMFGKKKKKKAPNESKWLLYVRMCLLFILIMLTNIFFKSSSVSQAIVYIGRLFTIDIFTVPGLYRSQVPPVFVMLFVEWLQRNREHGLQTLAMGLPVVIRWLIYFLLIAAIFIYNGKEQQFIYFQF